MRTALVGTLGSAIVLATLGSLHAEQITSKCRITGVDAVKRTVTLVRTTASGERTGVAKLAEIVRIEADGKPTELGSLRVPVDVTVIFDTGLNALVAITVPPAEGGQANSVEPGFVSLFDGKTLNGWRGDTRHYFVDGGNLVSDFGLAMNREKKCYLFTEREYGDFTIRLDFRLGTDGNSGLLIRTPAETQAESTDYLEVQILEDSSPRFRTVPAHMKNGSLCNVKASRNGSALPPGQWNRLEVLCQGRQVRIDLNGGIVLDTNLDEENDKIPGWKPFAGTQRSRGSIGFNGDFSWGRVEYRNIRIREL